MKTQRMAAIAIVSALFACSPIEEQKSPTSDFTAATQSSTITIQTGKSGTIAFTTATTLGDPQDVSFTMASNPAGPTGTFTPPTVKSGAPTTLTVSTNSAAAGNYTLTVTATGTAATHTATILLTISAGRVQSDFNFAMVPAQLTAVQGSTYHASVSASFKSGTDELINLAITSTPTGATPVLKDQAIQTGFSTDIAIAVGTSMPTGDYSLVVTGTGAQSGQVHTATLALKVVSPPPPNDFTLEVQPTVSILTGANAPIVVWARKTALSSAHDVAWTVSGLPAGASATFNPTTVTTDTPSTFTITTGTAAVGTYSLTLTGTSNVTSHTAPLTLNVKATLPANTFNLSTSLTAVTVLQGGPSATIQAAASVVTGGYQTVNLSVACVPATGVISTFGSASSGTGVPTTLTFAADNTAAIGSHTCTITGDNGTQTPQPTKVVTLTVNAPPPPNDFTLEVQPTVSILTGANAPIVVWARKTALSSAHDVAWTVSGLPAGASATFNPTTVTTDTPSTFTITTGTAAVGTYSLTLTGTSNVTSHTAPLTLNVKATLPANTFNLSTSLTAVTVLQGGPSATIQAAASVVTGGYQTVNLSVACVPATGVISTFGSASSGTGVPTTLTFAADNTAAIGSHTCTITGDNGTQTPQPTKVVTLTVNAPPPPNDFTVAVAGTNSASLTLVKSTSASVTVTATRTSGSDQNLVLTGSSSPSGVTGVFSPTSITTGVPNGNASTLTLTAGSATGTFMYMVTGTAPSGAKTATVTVTVVDALVANTYTVQATPATIIVAQGGSGTARLDTSVATGVNQTVNFTTPAAAAGITPSLSAATTQTGIPVTITFAVASNATLGDTTFTVANSNTDGFSPAAALTIKVTVVAPPPPNDFTVAVAGTNSASLTLVKSTSASVTVTATRTSGSDQNLVLTGSSSPSGVTGVFSPTSITTGVPNGNASTLTLTAGSATGTFMYMVTGTAPSGAKTATVTVTVVDALVANTYTVQATPATIIVAQGGSGTARLDTSVATGVNQTVNFTTPAAAAGITPSLSAATTQTGIPVTITFAVASNATLGDTTFTVANSNTDGFSPAAALTIKVTVVAPPPPNDFTVAASAATMSAQAGNAVSIRITPQKTAGSTDQPISYSVSGVPVNTTTSFYPSPGFTGVPTDFTVFTTLTTPPGLYHLTVTGNNGTVSRNVPGTVDLTVTAPPVPNEFAMAASPSSVTITAGASGTTAIGPTWVSGADPQTIALSATGVPTGATVSFNPTSVDVTAGGNPTSTMTINTGTAAAGTYSLTVSGSNSTTSHSTPVSLTIGNPPPVNDFSILVTNNDFSHPAVLNLSAGQTGGLAILTTVINGSSVNIDFSASNIPTGIVVSPIGSCASGGSSSISVRQNSAASGSYVITVTGTGPGGVAVHTSTFTVNVP